MRIGYFGYRGWAFKFLDRLLAGIDVQKSTIPLIGTVEYREEKIEYTRYPRLRFFDPKKKAELVALIDEYKIDVALFYGWSWIVPKELTERMDCLCLHPSLLPKYRGGTPFQHQILNNEQEGGLTIFRMNDILDGGDILGQRSFPLTGTLEDILGRVVEQGASATLDIVRAYEQGTVRYIVQQNLEAFPPYPRRKPEQSEVKFEQLSTITCNDFYNFVRALDDPFPNCRITFHDNRIILLKQVEACLPSSGGIIFDGSIHSFEAGRPTYIKLQDGYMEVIRYEIK